MNGPAGKDLRGFFYVTGVPEAGSGALDCPPGVLYHISGDGLSCRGYMPRKVRTSQGRDAG